MHEMSLCEGIRTIISEQAERHHFTRVTRVRLEIGAFSGVEKPALEFAFDVVMRGSPAEGAQLEMEDLAGTALCYECGQTSLIENRLDPCPRCGSGRMLVQDGGEMRIKDLEVM
ncbi:MAG: hydrogenase maturation nickel metallochaperone HypA [Hyphomicrobiales bacterium]|nr:hydrogenase maturation nickel metallochaperone HypA [Hyphomicrobiales bacterium]